MMDQIRAMYLVGEREFKSSLFSLRTIIIGVLFLVAVGIVTFGVVSLGPGTGQAQSDASGSELSFFAFTIAVYLFAPIIGIAIGYDTVSSERASGTLDLVLSKPVQKSSMLLGKYGGRALAAAVPIVAGLGLGLGVASFQFEMPATLLVAFIGLTVLLVWTFQAIAQTVSTFVSQSSTAILSAIGLWILFATPIWFIVQSGLVDHLGLAFEAVAALNPILLFYGGVLSFLQDTLTQGSPLLAFLATFSGGRRDYGSTPVWGLAAYAAVFVASSTIAFHMQDEG